jgi:hypothetical protein
MVAATTEHEQRFDVGGLVMPGLLDYQVDPIAMGLLGAGGALMTPRAQGGGIGAAMQAFPQQMMQGQEMQRRMQEQALRQKALTDRAEMDRKRFGMEEQEFGLKRDEATRKQAEMRTKMEVIQQIRGQIALEKPELLPMFDMDPMKAMERMFPEPAKPQVVAPGAALVSGDREIYRNPDKPATPPEIQRLIEARNALPPGSPDRKLIEDRIAALNYRQPAANLNVSYGAPFEGIGPDGRPMLFQPSNRGGPPVSTGLAAPPKAGVKPTEDENRSAGLAVRMEDALRTLTAVTEKNPGAATPPVFQSMVGMVSEKAANAMTPVDRQRVEAAQLDALDAALTLATGAAYTKEQLAGLSKAYFPQIGDKEKTIEEKRARLGKVIETARIRAGSQAPNINRILDKGTAGASPQSFPMLPNAREHDGKIARDQQTGKRYKSENGQWVVVP